MRLILAVLIALPSFSVAGNVTWTTNPNNVTVYGRGAVVTREASVSLAAGAHELTLPGLPNWLDPRYIRVSVQGVSLFIDNTFVGETRFDQVPAGTEADLPFGPIEAPRLSRSALDENNGDRGFISRTSTQTENARLNIENIGAVDWRVEVIDSVPYSIDEDLEITWTASPQPNVVDLDNQRGVLEWDVDVPAGTTTLIYVDQDLQWPDDKVLR